MGIGSRHIQLVYLLFAIGIAHCKSPGKEAPILLYNGAGTSPNDVAAIENLLSANRLEFSLANSGQLNGMDKGRLMKYSLIIIPGGDFIKMGEGLTSETAQNIREAVHDGLNYLGICAGGFLAGRLPDNDFDFARGVQFSFYAAEDQGIRKAAVPVSNADGSIIEHYWEDGPQFSGWGEVISKYPDSTAATVQGRFGSGRIILTGIHPEAPESWRKAFHFSTSVEQSHEYAAKLIRAALEGKGMTHF